MRRHTLPDKMDAGSGRCRGLHGRGRPRRWTVMDHASYALLTTECAGFRVEPRLFLAPISMLLVLGRRVVELFDRMVRSRFGRPRIRLLPWIFAVANLIAWVLWARLPVAPQFIDGLSGFVLAGVSVFVVTRFSKYLSCNVIDATDKDFVLK